MTKARLAAAVAALSLSVLLTSCGSGTPQPPDPPDDELFAIIEHGGRVEVPAGVGVPASQLTVRTVLGNAVVAANGDFVVPVFAGGRQFTLVAGPSGSPMLLGWVGHARPNLSVRSTAEALVFFGARAHALPPELWVDFMDRLAESDQLAGLTAAITAALAEDPEALANSNAAILDALAETLVELGASLEPTGVLVNPPDGRSGLTIDQPGLNEIAITNHYRRRATAFLDQVAFRDGEGATVPWEVASVAVRKLNPSVSLASLTTLMVDIYSGNYAFSPVTGDPIKLEVVPQDAAAAVYRLTIVGPGGVLSDTGLLSQAQLTEYRLLWLRTIVQDLVLPQVTTIFIPMGKESINAFLGAQIADSLVTDLVNWYLTTVPSVLELATQGKHFEAAAAALDAVRASSTGRTLLLETLKAIMSAVSSEAGAQAVADAFGEEGLLGQVDKALGSLDMLLLEADLAVMMSHIVKSRGVEQWDITVDRAKVKLTPERSFTDPYNFVGLTATVPEATGPNAALLVYHWSNTGVAGRLSDGPHYGNDFDSSSNYVAYHPNTGLGNEKQVDTVTVQVFIKEAGAEPVPLGSAQATVTVQGDEVIVAPRKASLQEGASRTFTASLNPQPVGNDQLFYSWSLGGALGSIDVPQGALVTNRSVSYRADDNAEGGDSLTVEVFASIGGELVSLGSDVATIKVEEEPTVMAGAWTIVTDSYTDSIGNPRTCASVYLAIERVEEAVSYLAEGYHFFDPYYYQNAVTKQVGERADWPGYESPCYGNTHLDGNVILVPLTGSHGPAVDVSYYEGRFAGMVVDVTVNFK